MKEGIKIPYVLPPVSPMVYGWGTAPMITGKGTCRSFGQGLRMGLLLLDTAENYGKSEISLGRWINSRT